MFNFTDVWRWRHPTLRAFTCHSASYKTFSRIDLVYSGGPVLSRVKDVTILPRGVSDHAPVSLTLEMSCAPSEGLWRLSRFWLSDSRIELPGKADMEAFWSTRDRNVSLPDSWDAFKVCMRGNFQAHIGRIRREAHRELQSAEARTQALESRYVEERSPQVYAQYREALRDVNLLRASATKVRLLHQSQRIFEQGERNGRLLAWLSREHSSPTSISRILSPDGEILTEASQINDRFASYYRDLYSSRAQHTEQELCTYLDQVDLPCLTDSVREQLDSPLTLTEIQAAVK